MTVKQKADSFTALNKAKGMTDTTHQPEWEMLLSQIELEVQAMYMTTTLDPSDQSKWGESYKTDNEIRTTTHNNAVRVATQAFREKLLLTLRKNYAITTISRK